eukprot:Skav222803  [mRNA]  locus=scaffold1419:458003:460145:+ [translate_table: standard]
MVIQDLSFNVLRDSAKESVTMFKAAVDEGDEVEDAWGGSSSSSTYGHYGDLVCLPRSVLAAGFRIKGNSYGSPYGGNPYGGNPYGNTYGNYGNPYANTYGNYGYPHGRLAL